MSLRVAAFALCCAACGAWASHALAQEQAPSEGSSQRPTIAILTFPEDPFGLRVAAELRELGFETVLVDPKGQEASRAALEASARAAGAIAAVRAFPSPRGVEVWIADRVTGKTLLRELSSADADGEQALALRTVELLRASLLEVSLPEAPAGEVPATPELTRRFGLPPTVPPASEPSPAFRISFASGLLLSPGGFDGAPSLVAGVDWMFSEHAGFAALAALPMGTSRVRRDEGSADLSTWMAGGGVRLLFTTRERPWVPSADLGLLGVSLSGTGTPEPGFAANEASSVLVAPFARLGLAFALTPRFRLRADFAAGGVTQRVTIRIAGSDAATWGSPFTLSSLGLDYGWF